MAVKIIHDRDVCIGCGACVAVCPANWDMGSDGKSVLKSGKKNGKLFIAEAKDAGCNMAAAQSCPVNCIHLEEKGKKLV